MKTKIKDFNRKELFNHYNSKDNPFVIVSTKIDITNIYSKCKNYYASIAYFITLAVNKIDNFKYRYENDEFYIYDVVRPNFTEPFDDMNIGFFTCDLKEDYNSFIDEYKNIKQKFLSSHTCCTSNEQDEIWFSCTPWFSMTSVVTPFDKKITIPQFLWDKFSFEKDRCYINLNIMAHHGFVDGYHISLFLKEFNEIIENIDKYI